ncbi:hypothetical protein NUW58_g2239 [Xylaria curta]|uniref:Uncharacterized protein n=1 Tax=Xylaria curta TaxID=42375 RepID=A0ACC1PHQ8_9PEZI|nr:hypothetical protein NUW58_g2239 [Xylaria curta]
MLTDTEIDDAAKRLAAFRALCAKEDVLQHYADLLNSYRLLKSDLEEERVNRERYKQLARTQERNPFVLVIVDGDGYIFNDEFLLMGPDGGSQAAQHLNNVVKKSLHGKGLDNCDIMIRVYANLNSLSRTLSKHGLVSAEKRSLSPFMANFNRSYGLTDFVDAGELKENADFKIRALLNLHAENAQCKHIYFAACHDVGYVSSLTEFRGNRARFTLIKSPGVLFHDQFNRLGLGIEELPGVFRTAPLDGSIHHTIIYTNPNSSADLMRTTLSSGPPAATDTIYRSTNSKESQRICQFFQSGKCRFGGECKNVHIDAKIAPSANLTKPLNFDNDMMSGTSHVKSPITSLPYELDSASGMMSLRNEPAYHLPKKSDIPDGYVAVNRDSDRLDPYMKPPNSIISQRLRDLTNVTKFCNKQQLANACPKENCEYDHRPLPEELLPALEWLSRSQPCSKRGSCRAQTCVLGHICQNMECHYRNGKIKCKLPYHAHQVDLTFDHCELDPSYINPINTNNATSSPTSATSHLTNPVNQVPDVNHRDVS